MILRPLAPSPSDNERFVDAWPIIERLQRENYEACWMVTQPSHAALSGDIATKLTGPNIPQLDDSLIRAIALHDAGWGQPDAEAIVHNRARSGNPPKSFIDIGVPDFLAAWTQSVEIAQKASKTGGYMVSRHFWRLAEHRLAHAGDSQANRKKLQGFLNSESARQKKLASGENRTGEELEQLTDLLQLCDLLSLYICCGAQQGVQLPEYLGIKATLSVNGEKIHFDPAVLQPDTQFSIAALRHPVTREESSREIRVKIE